MYFLFYRGLMRTSKKNCDELEIINNAAIARPLAPKSSARLIQAHAHPTTVLGDTSARVFYRLGCNFLKLNVMESGTWDPVVGEPPIRPTPCNAAKPALVAPLWVAKGVGEGVARRGSTLAS